MNKITPIHFYANNKKNTLPISEFFNLLGAKLRNPRWSWGAEQNSKNPKFVIFRIWNDEIIESEGLRYVRISEARSYEQTTKKKHLGKLERTRQIEALESMDAEKNQKNVFAVACKRRPKSHGRPSVIIEYDELSILHLERTPKQIDDGMYLKEIKSISTQDFLSNFNN